MSLQAILKQAMQQSIVNQAVLEMNTVKELQDAYAQGHIIVVDYDFDGQKVGYSLSNCEVSNFYEVAKDVAKHNYKYEIIEQKHLHNGIKRVYSFDEVTYAYYGFENKRVLAYFGEDIAFVLKYQNKMVVHRGCEALLRDYVNEKTDFNKVIIAIID